jgi:hypothetical protein
VARNPGRATVAAGGDPDATLLPFRTCKAPGAGGADENTVLIEIDAGAADLRPVSTDSVTTFTVYTERLANTPEGTTTDAKLPLATTGEAADHTLAPAAFATVNSPTTHADVTRHTPPEAAATLADSVGVAEVVALATNVEIGPKLRFVGDDGSARSTPKFK